jgi:hypothetical protein
MIAGCGMNMIMNILVPYEAAYFFARKMIMTSQEVFLSRELYKAL